MSTPNFENTYTLPELQPKTIIHPGFEFFETDKSFFGQYQIASGDKLCACMGYTNIGIPLAPVVIREMSVYVSQFGLPTNDQELYSYQCVSSIINNYGQAVFVKIPYDNSINSLNTATNTFTTNKRVLKYTFTDYTNTATTDLLSPLYPANTTFKNLSVTPDLVADTTLALEPNDCDFVIVNKNDGFVTTIGNKGETEEIIVTVIGQGNVLYTQGMLNAALPDAGIYQSNSVILNSPDNSKLLWGQESQYWTYTQDIVSLTNPLLKRWKTPIQKTANGLIDLTNKQGHLITVIVSTKSNYLQPLESFTGLLESGYENSLTSLINGISQYIYISTKEDYTQILPDTASIYIAGQTAYRSSFIDDADISPNNAQKISTRKYILSNANRNYSPVNLIKQGMSTLINFNGSDSLNKYPISDFFDAGLSSVYSMCVEDNLHNVVYTPYISSPTETILNNDYLNISRWQAIAHEYNRFAKYDYNMYLMVYIDAPRSLLLKGNLERTIANAHEFDSIITTQKMQALRLGHTEFLFCSVNWFAVASPTSNTSVWAPSSCFISGNICNINKNYQANNPPAGEKYGLLDSSILKTAIDPDGDQADILYFNNFNYSNVKCFHGVKLLGNSNSAVKTISDRRLANELKRIVIAVGESYIGEINNVSTRAAFAEDIATEYDNYIANGSLYDYKITCDESLNTEETILNGELRARILVKFNGVIEYVTATFSAQRTVFETYSSTWK